MPHIQIEQIQINMENKTLQKGETKKLDITILPQEASNNKVIYTSSNPQVATIDDKGNIQAISSGKTTITVKAEENETKRQIEITVYSKVTDIVLDQQEIYIEEGYTFQINGMVKPEDANEQTIIYSSSNENIATIAQNGLIQAINVGDTKIIAYSKENSNIQAECKVNVVRKMEETEISFDSSLTVNSLEVSGIDYNKNKVSDIKNKITTNLEIDIVNYKNEVLKESDIVGTGSKIRVKENGKILRQYNIIIYGDANGDGKIDSMDLLVIRRHILELEMLKGVFIKASNISKNGKMPTSWDLLLIQRHILKLQTIEQ